MEHYRVDVGSGGKMYFRRRRTAVRGLADVLRLSAGAEFSELDNYFVVEQALVDGTLPDPSRKWEQSGQWIAPYQWDMLIYMWSNAEIAVTSESFSGLAAAWKHVGLNRDIMGQVQEQKRRKRELFTGLERAGLLEHLRTSPKGRRTYRDIKLAPVWLHDGLVPSGLSRTWANLSLSDRKWFKMAMQPFTQPARKRERCAWADLTHIDRRALAASYLFFNDKEFAAIDPNHLCLRGPNLVFSDAFRRAVGRNATPEELAEALGELWRRGLIAFMSVTFDEDRPFPAAPRHIRYATRSDTSEDAVVVLRYVPKPGDPGEADA